MTYSKISKNGKKKELERFAVLLKDEKFDEAKSLADLIKGNSESNAIVNYTGYQVISQYFHNNKEKARRIAYAFKEYSWPLWLKDL